MNQNIEQVCDRMQVARTLRKQRPGRVRTYTGGPNVADATRSCAIPDCPKIAAQRGWCPMHYERWRRHGDPLKTQPTAAERFRATYQVVESGCWIYPVTNGHRYARVTVNGGRQRAHRFAYELLVGPIPEGLVLDHLCRVPACVNPAHLEPVTQAENVRRANEQDGRGKYKTECPQGHPYTEANTHLGPKGYRSCRACHRASEARRRNG